MVRDVVVDGQAIVRDGRCTNVDLEGIERELRGMYRSSAGRLTPFQRAWPALLADVQSWFETQLACS
jgi:hypothetical protein